MNKSSVLFLIYIIIISFNQKIYTQQNQTGNPPCISLENTPLSSLAGKWKVDWKYRTSPEQYEDLTAVSVIEFDLNGCCLVEHFEGSLNGHDFSAITMISEKSEGVFDRVKIDSEHGGFTQSSGHIKGDSLVFDWQRDLGNRIIRTRHYYFDISETSFVVEFYLSPSEGTPWQLVQRARYLKEE